MHGNNYFQIAEQKCTYSFNKFLFMKKYFTLVLIILIAASSKAQTDNGRKMALGFIAAPTINWLSSRDAYTTSAGSVAGFKFGINGDFYFAPNYAFNTGLFLHKTGGKLQYNADSSRFEVGNEELVLKKGDELKYDISYLEVPLSLRLQTSDFNRFIFMGRFGFTPMIRTRAESGDGKNLQKEVGFFNLNYHIGAGCEYFISGNTGITFNVVYTDGIIDITKDNLGKSDHTTLDGIEFIVGINF